MEDRGQEAYSPLNLAFLGDCVYELLVREYLLQKGNRPVKEHNREKLTLVSCKAQARGAQGILPLLTPKETEVFKRGRNAKTATVPKSAGPADYHWATGLEALMGYLYLSGQRQRLRELFQHTLKHILGEC